MNNITQTAYVLPLGAIHHNMKIKPIILFVVDDIHAHQRLKDANVIF